MLHASAGVGDLLVHRHQPHEQVARQALLRLTHLTVDRAGPLIEGAAHPADLFIRCVREPLGVATLPELRKRELQLKSRGAFLWWSLPGLLQMVIIR